jgi:palmitoyltransferase ZDHHC9/14/18
MLEALRDSPASAVVILVSFFGMWTVLGLAGFHTYLICVEQTTNEDVSENRMEFCRK